MPQKLTTVLAALFVASTSIAPAVALAAAVPTESGALAAPASCASLTSLVLPNTTINSPAVVPAGVIPPPLPFLPATPVVETCRVHATVTTPGVNDHIGVDVWLPVSGWNGRFQGVGGSGYKADDPNAMALAVDNGYSVVDSAIRLSAST